MDDPIRLKGILSIMNGWQRDGKRQANGLQPFERIPVWVHFRVRGHISIHHCLEIEVYIELDETEIVLFKVTSKLLYNKFKTIKQTPPLTAQKKMKNK